jgi:hypothetical protein
MAKWQNGKMAKWQNGKNLKYRECGIYNFI